MELPEKIKELKRDRGVREVVDERMREFERSDLFSELCFCILTANSTAERCVGVQESVGKGFVNLSFDELVLELKGNGCRFHTKRAEYIVGARRVAGELDRVLKMGCGEARDWLVANVKGLGMKEASHFLRNVGVKGVGIIDFHVINLLVREKLIERAGRLDKKRYLEIEEVLREMGGKLGMSLAELDLYLWHLETGKVLK